MLSAWEWLFPIPEDKLHPEGGLLKLVIIEHGVLRAYFAAKSAEQCPAIGAIDDDRVIESRVR